MNASNIDHERTRPLAFRTNKATSLIETLLQRSSRCPPGIARGRALRKDRGAEPYSRAVTIGSRRYWPPFPAKRPPRRAAAAWPPRLTRGQDVVPDALWRQVDKRPMQNALLIHAARVDA